MSQNYHTNDEGVSGLCRAKTPEACPIQDAKYHGSTLQEARQLYEQQMQDELYVSHQKTEASLDTAQNAVVWEDDRPQYQLSPSALQKAEQKIAKANKRLEKYGIEERFELEVIEQDEGAVTRNGITLYRPRYTVSVNRPRIAPEGYSFEAVATATPDGKLIITPSASGALNEAHVPSSQRCDHCQQNRQREKTYLIRNPQGEIEQVGSTCVDAYLGVKVQGLWALEDDPLAEDDGTWHDEEDEDFYRSGRYHDMPRDTEEMMAYVLAVSDGGKNFVSKTAEMYSGKTSTATQIEHAIWSEGSSMQDDIQSKADAYIRSGEAAKMLKKVQEEAEKRDGEYWMNVKNVSSGSMINPKHMGIFASSVGTLHKEEQERKRKAEERASYVPGFAGEVKEKIKDRRGKVKDVRHFSSYNSYTRQEEERTVLTFTDEKGREMVWFSSKRIDDAEIGAPVRFTGGSVKEHKQYDGKDQTVLTRVKFEEVDET